LNLARREIAGADWLVDGRAFKILIHRHLTKNISGEEDLFDPEFG